MNAHEVRTHGGWRPAPNRFLRIVDDSLYLLVNQYQWYIDMNDSTPVLTSGASDIRDLQLVPRLNGVRIEP